MRLPAASVLDPTESPPQEMAEAVDESRDVARRGRGFERTNVRDGPPFAASRRSHTRHVIKRNVTKKFVRASANSDTRLRTHAS